MKTTKLKKSISGKMRYYGNIKVSFGKDNMANFLVIRSLYKETFVPAKSATEIIKICKAEYNTFGENEVFSECIEDYQKRYALAIENVEEHFSELREKK